MPTAVSIAARILGSNQSGLVVGTKLGTIEMPYDGLAVVRPN